MDDFESLLEFDLDSLVDGLGLNVVDGLGLNVGTNVVSDPVNILPLRGEVLDDFDSLLELSSILPLRGKNLVDFKLPS